MASEVVDLEVETVVDEIEKVINQIREEKRLTPYPKSSYAEFKLFSALIFSTCPTSLKLCKQLRCDME